MDIFKNNVDFNLYKTFYAVAIFKSFSKAANALYVSQPSISHSIKKLEEDLGIKLFIRLNKSIKLTDSGERLLFYIENAFNNLISGYKALKESNDEFTGEISIGIHSHIGTFLLPKYIKKFITLHPNVKISIYNSRSSELKQNMQEGKLDILILHFPIFPDSENYIEEKILSCESCFFSTKKFYDSFIMAEKDMLLFEYPLLLPLKGYVTSNALDKAFKKSNMILKSNIYLYTTEMIVSLVREGLGIGWTLKDCIAKELEDGIFYEIPVKMEMPKIDLGLAYNKSTINKTAYEFAQFLLEELKNKK